MTGVDTLSEREVLLISEALRAVTTGRWITHRELSTRLGIELADAARIAAGWPAVPVEGMLRANGKGQVFATEKALNPTEAFDEVFIGAPTHAGRGQFVIEFTPKSGVTFGPGKPGELIHQGTVRAGRHADVIYAGPNLYP